MHKLSSVLDKLRELKDIGLDNELVNQLEQNLEELCLELTLILAQLFDIKTKIDELLSRTDIKVSKVSVLNDYARKLLVKLREVKDLEDLLSSVESRAEKELILLMIKEFWRCKLIDIDFKLDENDKVKIYIQLNLSQLTSS